ncbi:hypothetical protein PR048_025547 [Dryococelus australis]|uniref:Reverse transcriptase n=1 Tax=Dryococelus australis TaxID=614101 RepID=A0ABQ9GRL3_9NEOP|nr:hypothetical protein PR048_025547 [Dryococelus australis]
MKGHADKFEEQWVIKEKVDEMLKEGVAELLNRWCNSHILLVPKKDGGIRFRMDFHPLNLVTESTHPSSTQIRMQEALRSAGSTPWT